MLGRVLIEQAERFAKSDPHRALALLGELAASKDLKPDVKQAERIKKVQGDRA